MNHVIWLSGGKDSTALALALKDKQPETRFIYACTPTGDELPEMLIHWVNLERMLGQPIQMVSRQGGLNGLIEHFNALPNHRQRWCTRMLKIEMARAFMKSLGPCVSYVGLRADEETRKGGIFGEDVEQRYPFQDWGWGIGEVLQFLAEKEVKIPDRTDCARCPYQRLIEWFNLWLFYPDVYESAVQQEEKTGHTFRSASRDSWPASLAGLRAKFEHGERPKHGGQMDLFETHTACRVCTI